MTIPKTWTATDIRMGKQTHICIDNILYLYQRYQFVDIDGNILPIEEGRLTLEISLPDIPVSILAALGKIEQWTKQKALEQEGMV